MLIIRAGDNFEERKKSSDKYPECFSDINIYIKGPEILGLKQYLGQDIFGETLKIKIEDWNIEEYRSYLYKHLEDLKESKNIFIIDELDILDTTFKKLATYAEKSFDCRQEKIKESGFYLGDLILQRNKKDAWIEYLRLLKVGEPVESIIGAVNYKLKYARNMDKEKLFANNIISLAQSHDSKGDAEIDLEKLILDL